VEAVEKKHVGRRLFLFYLRQSRRGTAALPLATRGGGGFGAAAACCSQRLPGPKTDPRPPVLQPGRSVPQGWLGAGLAAIEAQRATDAHTTTSAGSMRGESPEATRRPLQSPLPWVLW
jgi:hypothetical protein